MGSLRNKPPECRDDLLGQLKHNKIDPRNRKTELLGPWLESQRFFEKLNANSRLELVKPSLNSTARTEKLITEGKKATSIAKKNSATGRGEYSESSHSPNLNKNATYSDPLLPSIKTWIRSLDDYNDKINEVFENDFHQLGPELNKRSCFNYFLLDPRVIKKKKNHNLEISWQTFLSAIFYIGKGKSDRPYDHLKYALKIKQTLPTAGKNHGKKIQTILDIWDESKSVIILRVFEHKVDEEALTREAAMIEVIGTRNLGNKINGTYYGQISTWKSKEKHELGRYLLYTSYQTYISKGGTRIFFDDL